MILPGVRAALPPGAELPLGLHALATRAAEDAAPERAESEPAALERAAGGPLTPAPRAESGAGPAAGWGRGTGAGGARGRELPKIRVIKVPVMLASAQARPPGRRLAASCPRPARQAPGAAESPARRENRSRPRRRSRR